MLPSANLTTNLHCLGIVILFHCLYLLATSDYAMPLNCVSFSASDNIIFYILLLFINFFKIEPNYYLLVVELKQHLGVRRWTFKELHVLG